MTGVNASVNSSHLNDVSIGAGRKDCLDSQCKGCLDSQCKRPLIHVGNDVNAEYVIQQCQNKCTTLFIMADLLDIVRVFGIIVRLVCNYSRNVSWLCCKIGMLDVPSPAGWVWWIQTHPWDTFLSLKTTPILFPRWTHPLFGVRLCYTTWVLLAERWKTLSLLKGAAAIGRWQVQIILLSLQISILCVFYAL